MVLWRPLLAMDDDAVYDNMMGFVPEFILWSWGVINCVSALRSMHDFSTIPH